METFEWDTVTQKQYSKCVGGVQEGLHEDNTADILNMSKKINKKKCKDTLKKKKKTKTTLGGD